MLLFVILPLLFEYHFFFIYFFTILSFTCRRPTSECFISIPCFLSTKRLNIGRKLILPLALWLVRTKPPLRFQLLLLALASTCPWVMHWPSTSSPTLTSPKENMMLYGGLFWLSGRGKSLKVQKINGLNLHFSKIVNILYCTQYDTQCIVRALVCWSVPHFPFGTDFNTLSTTHF